MRKFYKGEDIKIYVSGINDNGIDDTSLDGIDFVVRIYSCFSSVIRIPKSSCTNMGNGIYMLVIPASQTRRLPIGRYTLEVCSRSGFTGIKKIRDAFALENSESKNETL